MKILYIEDNKANAYLLKVMLKKYEIDIAYTAIDAMHQLQDKKYDLFLIDINLGVYDMDGVGLLQMIREIPQYKETPAYTVTAYAMSDDKQRFLDAGFDKYFSKPIDRLELLKSIATLEGQL